VYFIGEGSGYRDALGVNFEGVGLTEGRPQIIFPNANSNVQLGDCAKFVNPRTMKLDRSKLGERSQQNPLLPGDFVDLGELPSGTTLNFFIIADEITPDAVHAYTPFADHNPDGLDHMVAMAVDGSPWLLVSFEDMFKGGDKDYEDCVFAVGLSEGNVESIIGKINPWRRIKQLSLLGAAATLIIGGPSAFLVMRRRAKRRKLNRARRHAMELLQSAHPENALKIVEAIRTESLDKNWRAIWRGLEMDVFEKTRDVEGLRELLERSPRLFASREGPALTVARAELDDDHLETFSSIRNAWREREKHPGEWLSLEADFLSRQGKDFDALDLLSSRHFEGAADASRQVRLALLKAPENMQRASEMIDEAIALDPRNIDARLYKARFLETCGESADAIASCREALAIDPHNPRIKNILAETLRRAGDMENALRIWASSLEHPSLGRVWVKTLFWTRVGLRIHIQWNNLQPPRGTLRPLIDYLLNLEPNRFWDARAFAPIAERHPDLLSMQEIFWLRTLEALRTHMDGEALSLLNLQGFGSRSWNSCLESTLLKIVIYRLRGFLGTPLAQNADLATFTPPAHSFFAEMDEWTKHAGINLPEKASRILKGDCVFGAACFAVGWWEAGINMLRGLELPRDIPEWFINDIEEAKRRHKGIY
jgi:thioredoxin-like negative regulator of GroEL